MPEVDSSYPYPPLIPPCTTNGLACERCPYLPDCPYLELGSASLSKTALLITYEEALAREQQENQESRFDDVLPEFYTGSGIRREIQHNIKLASELKKRQWALIYCDVRGLKDLNDRFSRSKGNEQMRLAGRRFIDEAGIRTRRVPVDVNRRTSATVNDIGIRSAGSDELAALIRNVTPKQLEYVLKRQHNRFSAQSAVADYIKGHTPTILSFSGVHATELPPDLDPVDALSKAFDVADIRHHEYKTIQYEEMWHMVSAAAQKNGQVLERPADDRGIITFFMRWFCPDYFMHADKWLEREELAQL